MATDNTNPDTATRAATRIAGSARWRLFQLPEGGYAGGRRGAAMAAHIAIHGKPDAEKLAEIEAIPVEDGRVSEWDAAMQEYGG